MTRKHFKALAKALAAVRPSGIHPDVDHLLNRDARLINGQWLMERNAIANVCQFFSPQFDRERFIEACNE